jgi:hypothetical protein
MKIIIALTMVAYAGIASAQPRCVKWTWYNAGKAQKVICNQLSNR